ncbi:DUF4240 domain-containing protein [Kitasatospora sp. NPDC092948]|uniref:DUF4240 domain-containing protein n=1 Tax=Kitasatospora sp. NPDC092948 TaxID=3364088 RepID=UPI0037F85E09
MDLSVFWELVESTGEAASPCDRTKLLVERLGQLPLEEVLEFQLRLDEVRAPLDTRATVAVAKLVAPGRLSDDALWYFHAWLVGLGQDAYRQAVDDPDTLADHPEFGRLAALPEREVPGWEQLDYCAADAWEALTGNEDGLEEAMLAQGHDSPLVADPAGEPWTAEQTATRLPKLTALFAEAA